MLYKILCSTKFALIMISSVWSDLDFHNPKKACQIVLVSVEVLKTFLKFCIVQSFCCCEISVVSFFVL